MDEALILSVRAFLVVVRDHVSDASRAPRRAIDDVDIVLAQVEAGELDGTTAAQQIQERIEILLR